jgi:hypothetical protein
MRRAVSSRLITVAIIIAIPVAFLGIVYYSATSIELTMTNPTLQIGMINLPASIAATLAAGHLRGSFDMVMQGHSLVPTTVKSFEAKIYVEDIYVGEIRSEKWYIIPASGSMRVPMNFDLNITDVPTSDLSSIIESIIADNGDVKMSWAGYFEPVVIVFPIEMKYSSTSYYYYSYQTPQ